MTSLWTAILYCSSLAYGNPPCSEVFGGPYLNLSSGLVRFSVESARPAQGKKPTYDHIMTISAINTRGKYLELRFFKKNQVLEETLGILKGGQPSLSITGMRWWLLNEAQVSSINLGLYSHLLNMLPKEPLTVTVFEFPADFYNYRKVSLLENNPRAWFFLQTITHILDQHNLRIEQPDLRESPTGNFLLYNPEAIGPNNPRFWGSDK